MSRWITVKSDGDTVEFTTEEVSILRDILTEVKEIRRKCDSCYFAQNYNLEDDDTPCQNCGEDEDASETL